MQTEIGLGPYSGLLRTVLLGEGGNRRPMPLREAKCTFGIRRRSISSRSRESAPERTLPPSVTNSWRSFTGTAVTACKSITPKGQGRVNFSAISTIPAQCFERIDRG